MNKLILLIGTLAVASMGYAQCPTSGTISSNCTTTGNLNITGATLSVNPGDTVTVTGTLTIRAGGTLNGSGATFVLGNLATTYGSVNGINGGTYNFSNFSGGGNTDIANVNMTASGTFSSGYGTFNYSNSTINITGLFSVGSNDNNVDNCTINSGTGNAGTNDTNALIMNGGGALTLINNSAMNVRGSVINNEWIIDNSDVVVTGDFDNAGSEILEVRNNGTFTAQGDFDNSGSGNVSADNGAVVSVEGDYNNGGGGNTDVSGGTLVVGGTYAGNTPSGDTGDCDGGSGGCCGSGCATLPVRLLDFRAENLNNTVLLTWKTATELNNDFFTIERSFDGRNYETIQKVDGSGTTEKILSYSFEDKGKNFFTAYSEVYYRLSQTDFDGTYEILKVVAVQIASDKPELKVFPNPVAEGEELNIIGVSTLAEWKIYSIAGELLAQETFENDFKIHIGFLNKGSYIVLVTDQGNVRTLRFTVR